MGLTATATAGPRLNPSTQHGVLRKPQPAREGRAVSPDGTRRGQEGTWGLSGQTPLPHPPVRAAELDPGPFSPINIFQSLTWKQVS